MLTVNICEVAIGITVRLKVARYPEFSRSTNLESELIELFVLEKF